MALKISIITPSYNMSTFLEGTIKSVLLNMQPGDEYFIIDGGSRDGSIDIIKKYESNLTGWLSERDNGYADALSKGFKMATGDILCWINASDLLLRNTFSKVREVFSESHVDFIYGDDFCIDEDDRIVFHSKGGIPDLKNAMCYGGWTPLQDACFWRKKLYLDVEGINPELQYAADFDLFLRFAVSGQSKYVPYTFSAFRLHENQKSISGYQEYKKERKHSQMTNQEKCSDLWIKKLFLKMHYYFYLRFRVRLLRRIRNNKYNGQNVRNIRK